jgi:hypothetical protein
MTSARRGMRDDYEYYCKYCGISSHFPYTRIAALVVYWG